MKKVSLIRATVSFLVLLSFVGACLSRPTASAQERVAQESQVQNRDNKTEDAQEHKAKNGKSKGDRDKVKPMICNDCDPGDGGGGGGGGGYTGDGHIWCDGWDRQGDCAFSFPGVATGVVFRRQLGDHTNGYHNQCFLSWYAEDLDG